MRALWRKIGCGIRRAFHGLPAMIGSSVPAESTTPPRERFEDIGFLRGKIRESGGRRCRPGSTGSQEIRKKKSSWRATVIRQAPAPVKLRGSAALPPEPSLPPPAALAGNHNLVTHASDPSDHRMIWGNHPLEFLRRRGAFAILSAPGCSLLRFEERGNHKLHHFSNRRSSCR